MDSLLKLLDENARFSFEELASMTASTTEEVAAKIDEYERIGVLKGYKAVIDWERAGSDMVSSFIEVKITPKHNYGFDEFASEVAKFSEVQSVYLMSGGYDIMIEVLAKTFRDIAMFVSKRLSPMQSVLSTSTHFMLKRYKERGVNLSDTKNDERGYIT